VVLAAEALRRVVPEGRARRVIQLGRVLALAALVVLALPFLVGQIRQALYPALEQPNNSMQLGERPGAEFEAAEQQLRERAAGMAAQPAPPPEAIAAKRNVGPRSYEYAAVDPHSVVQTGPGLPGWVWTAVSLEWSGPVDRDQRLHLFLLSPAVNLL